MHLFNFCLETGNNHFLQTALKLSGFSKDIYREQEVVNNILLILKDGCRTNFILNVLSLTDIHFWKHRHIQQLIEVINDYVTMKYEKNRLLLSHNPLMSISLAAELLLNIAKARKMFENEC